MKLPRVLLLVWIAFLARGAFYAAVMPIWEGLDEYAHFAYVQHLTRHATLPKPETRVSDEISQSLRLVPLPSRLNTWAEPALTHDAYWNLSQGERLARQSALGRIPADTQTKEGIDGLYEGKQPPLYYLLCSPLLRVVQGAPLTTRVLLLRLFTVLLTSLVIPLTFMVAVSVLQKKTTAIVVTAFVASMPVLGMNASRVGNDSLSIVLFSALTLALLRKEPWRARGAILIGLLVGAGLLTKAYFVAAIPVVVFSALFAIFKSNSQARLRVVAGIFAAFLIVLLSSAWWYSGILGADGPLWADVAPQTKLTAGSLPGMLFTMPWWQAVQGAVTLHLYFSGWSFLSVHSWMYGVLGWTFIVLLLASMMAMVRKGQAGLVVWGVYGGFWLAMMYHAFVMYVSIGIPSSTGSYLYAVVSCEGVLLCSGFGLLLSPYWRDRAMVVLTGLFVVLELYATHFVVIPYYTGLIRYRPDTSLMAFHISQAVDLGLREVVDRLMINKAPFLTPGVMVFLWGVFLLATASLLVVGWREAERKA